MTPNRTVSQHLPIVIVFPDLLSPGSLRSVEMTVTTYGSGDWVVWSEDAGIVERGSADAFERSMAAFFLRLLPRPVPAGNGRHSHGAP